MCVGSGTDVDPKNLQVQTRCEDECARAPGPAHTGTARTPTSSERSSGLVGGACRHRHSRRRTDALPHLAGAIPRISQRVLALTFKHLQRGDDRPHRRCRGPSRVEYQLTDLGSSLLSSVLATAAWVTEHQAEIRQHQTDFDTARSPCGVEVYRGTESRAAASGDHEPESARTPDHVDRRGRPPRWQRTAHSVLRIERDPVRPSPASTAVETTTHIVAAEHRNLVGRSEPSACTRGPQVSRLDGRGRGLRAHVSGPALRLQLGPCCAKPVRHVAWSGCHPRERASELDAPRAQLCRSDPAAGAGTPRASARTGTH